LPHRIQMKTAIVALNRLTERAKVRVQPVHYYSEVPDRAALRRSADVWNRRVVPYGITWDLDAQAIWIDTVTHPYLGEVRGLASYREMADRGFGPGYGAIESQVLHCALRHEPPSRIVEIGSGVSTAVMAEAVRRNEAEGRGATRIVCIEPHPYDALTRLNVELIAQPAQIVEMEPFEALGPGDLLFIDSSHAVRTGSEVLPIYLQILPRLRAGVRIHIHDIYLPYLFHPDLFEQLWDWQETALLAALLAASNDRFAVDACLSALYHDRLPALQTALPDIRPRQMDGGLFIPGSEGDFPASIWLRSKH
jgi:hypothetical protein